MRWLKFLPRPLYKILATGHGFATRAMTLGVRGIILDDQRNVLLVRHTYMDGWHLPGGGVDRGETAVAAMIREAREEASITLTEPPRIFHIYKNARLNDLDHVAFFVCGKWEREGEWVPNSEIAEIGFFPLNALPSETTSDTRDRLAEALSGISVRDVW